MRRYPGIFYILLLIAALLAAEAIAIDHAVEHSFAGEGEICVLCDKADSFQYSLVDSGLPSFERVPNHNNSLPGTSPPYNGSLTDYYPRGPPLHPYF